MITLFFESEIMEYCQCILFLHNVFKRGVIGSYFFTLKSPKTVKYFKMDFTVTSHGKNRKMDLTLKTSYVEKMIEIFLKLS